MSTINAQSIINQASAALAIAPTGDEWEGTFSHLQQIIARSFDFFDETTCQDDYLIQRECEELTGEWLICNPEPAKFVTFQTSERGHHRVKNIRKNIESFIANVRRNAAAFGGGLVRQAKPRAAVTWPVASVALFKQMIEDNDYAAALDLADQKLGAIWFEKGLRVAPVACEEWPGLMSGMLSNGNWEVFEPVSGARAGTHSLYKKDRSRAAAIASTAAYFSGRSQESIIAAMNKAKDRAVFDQEAARALWMDEHGLSDDRSQAQHAKAEQQRIDEQAAARQARDIERAARAAQAAQDVAQVVAAAQAMAAIEQASESAALQEVASAEPAIEQQAQDSQELATVCEYEQQASENSAGAPNSPHGYIGSNHASQARQGGSAGHGQAINSKSGNWRATFFSGDDGAPSMVFNGGQVMVFESGSARMKALQTMARQADTEAAASTAARVCAAKQAAQEPKQTGAVPNSETPQDATPSATPGALQITITRAEGLISECDKPATVASFAAADALLHDWSETAPASGGYDKCDFLITWPNGDTYHGRYDLKHHNKEPASLTRHMIDAAEFHLGKYCPLHMKRAAYDDYLKHCVTDGDREAYAKVLQTMAELGDYFEKVRPVAIDLRALTHNGIEPDKLIGLGVVFSGGYGHNGGDGAIVGIEKNEWRPDKVELLITLEDGSQHRASLADFDENANNGYRLNMKTHGAPYLAQLAATVAMLRAQASAAKEQADKAHAQALIDLAAQYPQLQRVAPGQYGNGKLAAVNMRILLKEAFNGHKFSVTSDYNSVRVGWTDGPTDAEVTAIIGRFDIGAADTQQDYFYTVSTAFSELFGGVQYLNTYREDSDALIQRGIDQLYPDASTRPSVTDYRKNQGVFDWRGPDHARTELRALLASISTYTAPAGKARAKAA